MVLLLVSDKDYNQVSTTKHNELILPNFVNPLINNLVLQRQ